MAGGTSDSETVLSWQSLRLAGVVGDPVRHSLSPTIHNEWCRRNVINGLYMPLRVPDSDDDFALAIKGLERAGFAGVNVTMPHKARALSLATHASVSARMIGAANMLTFGDGQIHADNSDSAGFYHALEGLLVEDKAQRPESALVLGAGGAAGAICHALLDAGVDRLFLSNRTRSRAESLVHAMRGIQTKKHITIVDWAEREKVNAEIIINTSSLGMAGNPPLRFPFSASNGHRIAVDIVYHPLETQFLKEARSGGMRTLGGLDMLMHQAAPGFRRWFGGEADVDAPLKTLLLDSLAGAIKPRIRTIGLTGSIGMGKSTVARMFEDEGIPVWDADAAVHRLYDHGGAGVDALRQDFPACIRDGRVDRALLSKAVINMPEAMKLLEAIIHPLVAVDRQIFLRNTANAQVPLCLLDVPLLLEGGMADEFDLVIVVSAAPDVQRARVLSRPGMTSQKFEAILARQMPDADKRRLADHIIPTDVPMAQTRDIVRQLISVLAAPAQV